MEANRRLRTQGGDEGEDIRNLPWAVLVVVKKSRTSREAFCLGSTAHSLCPGQMYRLAVAEFVSVRVLHQRVSYSPKIPQERLFP